MCGILGSVNLSESSSYLHYLKHRGPDASGAITFKTNNHRIDLLHRRLSIVDLSEAGKQPMLSFDNKACITFNGEIYNHLELKPDLKDTHFNGHSDTETIVNYIREFGIASIKKLNGIFAFAFLDLENELLYLARDRFGVKPLYYCFNNNQLFFSSELRPLKAFFNPPIDKGSLMISLRLRYTPSPSTIFKNIYKVEPGQLLTFNLKKEISLTKSYFISSPRSLGTCKGEHNKLVKDYGDLFEKAVERQLMSDVEIGILLSGGIDSALVAAIAKQQSKTTIKAFTVGFKGNYGDIDEIEYAKQTAEILGLQHFYKKISFTDFLHSAKKIVEVVEEPIGTTSIIPMFYLSELAATNVKVVLSGQGADEPLGGYNKYKGLPWVERARMFQWLMPFTKSVGFIYNKNERFRRLISAMQHADDIDSLMEFNAISSSKQVVGLMNSANRHFYSEALTNQQSFFKQVWKKRMPDKSSLRNLFLYYDVRTSLADDLLMYTDKITMHFGLECRVPILDNELIDFIESLETHHKFNSNRGKIIHKDFAREYLPSAIIDRKKRGFASPTNSWFKENKNSLEEVLVNNAELKKYFSIAEVKRLLSSHFGGRNLEKQIFLLLSISYLLENSLDTDHRV